MKSLFKPEKSEYGERFVRTTYAIVVRNTGIDPITEGKILQKKINDQLFGDDFLKLKSSQERKEKLQIVNIMTDIYGQRMKKFWKIFFTYVYKRGQLRFITTAKNFIKNSEEKEKEIRKGII